MTLAVLIPALLIVGIGLRPDVPPVTDDGALFRMGGFAPQSGEDDVEVVGAGLRFALRALSDGRSIVIRPLEIIAKPDLLVYWSARAPKPDEDQNGRLAYAELVGSLSGRSSRIVQLPEDAQGGHLLVYSLAHGELLADLALEQLGSKDVVSTLPPIAQQTGELE